MASSIAFIVLMMVHFATGQTIPCSNLDISLQKKWTDKLDFSVTFSGTGMEMESQQGTKLFNCVAEREGFRLYRHDGELGAPEYICIKIEDDSQPNNLQLALSISIPINTNEGDETLVCFVCAMQRQTKSLVPEGTLGQPESPITLTCNMPNSCPEFRPGDVKCPPIPTESEIDVFCKKLLAIIEENSSKQQDSDSSEISDDDRGDVDDIGDDRRSYKETIIKRKRKNRGGKKGEKTKCKDSSNSSSSSGEMKGKGNCRGKLVSEILTKCASNVEEESTRSLGSRILNRGNRWTLGKQRHLV